MEYRDLGTTGIRVSAIGLGMAALGRPGYITIGHDVDLAGRTDLADLERHAFEVLDVAVAGGIGYVDAARSYGRAEPFLAAWLETQSPTPEAIVVGSKWGYVYTADWRVDADVHETKIHTPANLDRQYAESVGLLGAHLRVYQIHSATQESGVLDDVDVLQRLAELRASGLTIGLTTSGPNQAATIRRALEIEIEGVRLFGVAQATWNLLETSAGAALEEAADAGMGVIVKEAVANGRLTSRNPALAQHLDAMAPRWPLDAVAIAACLQQPWASVVLSGAATTDQVASNLTALDVPSDVVEQLPLLAESPEAYWETRGALPWR
jgi:aryl-alcohol dehydrogenase-like predicted oxidoreductase